MGRVAAVVAGTLAVAALLGGDEGIARVVLLVDAVDACQSERQRAPES